MRRFKFTILFLTISLLSANSQIKKIAEELGISSKTVIEASPDSTTIRDSLKIAELTDEIQQYKLNEILLQEKLLGYEQAKKIDSLTILRRKERIDSLRNVTPGAPVIIEGDTIFSIYTARGENSALTRSVRIKSMIYSLGEDWSVKPDSIRLFTLHGAIEIIYDDRIISIVSDDDALWMNMPLDSLAQAYREKIVDTVKYLQKKNSLMSLAKRTGEFLLVIIAVVLFIYGLNFLYKKSKKYVKKYVESKFTPVVIQNYQLLSVQQELNVLFLIMNILRYILILVALIIAIPILFSIFPQTKDLAETLFSYILTPIKSIFFGIIDYIPNLFTIIIICLCIRYTIKGLKYICKEIGAGRLKIPGFYADWAAPTFNLVRFLLYAFMIAMIFPYLPRSDSGVFQGISVFIGLIFSLGSTAVIGNIVAGFVITYMRPFKIGDMIKLNDTVGSVIEKTPFVTRIRTLKNEIITIPNSFMLSSQTTNYTASADTNGLIIYVSVGVCYDVPNTRVHELLIQAAKMTKGVMSDREPFVLDKKFEDFYQLYEINAYIKDASAMSRIYSELHHNIQNLFIEAGIDLNVPLIVSQTGTGDNTAAKE